METLTRTIEGPGPDGTWLVANARLELIGGNARPYFSLTGEEWKSQKHKRNGWERSGLQTCGAMGDTLAAVWPELDLVNRLHLADDTGAPMYAVENGWYWYTDRGGRGPSEYERIDGTPHEIAARYLRVDPADLPEGLDRAGFEKFVEKLRPRWQAEADAAVAWLKGRA